MSLRPFHRWKSFWFGVLVIAFLGWAWISSMGEERSLTWITKNWIATFTQNPGKVEFQRFNVPGAFASDLSSSYRAPPQGPWLADWADWWGSLDVYLVISIAHWFLILLFLIPWTAYLLWRSRRMKRLAVEAGEPQA